VLLRHYQGAIKALSRRFQGALKALLRLYDAGPPFKALLRLYDAFKALLRLYDAFKALLRLYDAFKALLRLYDAFKALLRLYDAGPPFLSTRASTSQFFEEYGVAQYESLLQGLLQGCVSMDREHTEGLLHLSPHDWVQSLSRALIEP
jgi:hypothetical protein